MFQFLKHKQELTLILLGMLLFLVVAAYLLFGMSFLVRNLNGIFDTSERSSATPVQFDIDGAKALGL